MSKGDFVDKNSISGIFADTLKDLMLEAKMQVCTLASELNLNQSSIYKWLDGNTLPSLPNAVLIADRFCCSLDYLFGLKEHDYDYHPSTSSVSFGDRFKRFLKESGLTEYRFVRISGIARSKVSAWRNNHSLPCIENLVTMAAILNVTLDALVGRE